MYDTLVVNLDWSQPIDERSFQGGHIQSDLRTGANVKRLWFNPKDAFLPRATYWRGVDEFRGGRLRLEFSLPKLASVPPTANMNAAAVTLALDVATGFARTHFSRELPDMREWRVSRVDYAWNFQVGADYAAYAAMLQRLHVGGMRRHVYDETGGVVWKTKQRNARAIKFYDKSLESGVGEGVLRFEVSNYRKVVSYMADKWFGCSRTVGAMVRPGRALLCMAYQWDKLGLGADAYRLSGAGLMHRLRAEFGRSAAAAYWSLQCISTYGGDAHRVHHLMTENSYHVWKKKLSAAGYLSEDMSSTEQALAGLSLPVFDVFDQCETAQNLESGLVGSIDTEKKISAKMDGTWQKICRNLGVISTKESPYLLKEWAKWRAGAVFDSALSTIRINEVQSA